LHILFCGDVVGRTGRDAVKQHLPRLRTELAIDLAIVNAENAAHGFGLTERLAGELYDAGADILSPISTAIHACCDRPTSRRGRPARGIAFTRSATGAMCSL
jgi:hypothetical protein